MTLESVFEVIFFLVPSVRCLASKRRESYSSTYCCSVSQVSRNMANSYAVVFLLLLAVQLCLEIGRMSSERSVLHFLDRSGEGRVGGETVSNTPPPLQRAEYDDVVVVKKKSLSREDGTAADFSPLLQRFNRFPEFDLPFSLQGCRHVYLDLGTNQGRQLRKLFLGLAPESMWAKKFNEHFGSNMTERRRTVCAIGAEPDRNHKAQLDALEQQLTTLGVRVRIIRNPVWVNNDVLTFNSIYDPNNTHDSSTLSTAGYSVYDHTTKSRTTNVNLTKVELRGFRLSTLLSQLPLSSTVLVKLDIEGAEHRVIADILMDGTICRIDFLGIEFHRHLMKADRHLLSMQPAELHRLLVVSQRCKKTTAAHFDDEG
jgi:FkbM family methyltransferase